MYFHASQTEKIKILEPRISNHNIPFIYFSDKRENVLVYLSNAVEKFVKKNILCLTACGINGAHTDLKKTVN